MSFTERSREWLKGDPSSPMFSGRYEVRGDVELPADEAAVAERHIAQADSERVSTKVPVESQASVGLLLEAILDELRKLNSTPREGGSVSSVLIEDNPTKDRIVRVTSKVYAGSPLPVEEAIEAHGRAHRLAEQHALDGWAATIEALRA